MTSEHSWTEDILGIFSPQYELMEAGCPVHDSSCLSAQDCVADAARLAPMLCVVLGCCEGDLSCVTEVTLARAASRYR